MLFHITERTSWGTAQSEGIYRADSLDNEGFIHLSTAKQVIETANRFYKGQSELVLLEISEDLMQANLLYDDVPDHGKFPHLYGPLNLDAVIQTWPFEPKADGSFVMPNSQSIPHC